jgi:CDP-diglyceride synthetase
VDYSAIDDNFIKMHSLDVLADMLVIRMTWYAIILAAILLGLCMIGWIVRTLLQRRLGKKDSKNEINEMKT